MIEVAHLTKYYGAFPALRDITFNVEKGEILGFLGPNGAGKTTTMRIIAGYLPATSGTVRVAGFDVAEKSIEARKHLGYLPETVPLYTELTTYEYLDFRGRITGLHNPKDRRARIFEVMDQLNVGDVSDKLIGALSRGYRQRVGLAQALLHNPDALILDEPTVGLDPVQITEVRELIKELGRNHTVILSTHLLPEVSMVCNRVIIINRGRLVALDTPIHLAQGVAGVQTVQLEVGGTRADVLKTLQAVPGVAQARIVQAGKDGLAAYSASGTGAGATPTNGNAAVGTFQVDSKPGADIRSALAQALIGAGHQLYELKSITPTLEDVFIQVITREEEEAAEEYEGDRVYDGATGDAFLEDVDQPLPVRSATDAPRQKVTAKKRVRR
jgi:ABC-2 type transport system ATP-binding protein